MENRKTKLEIIDETVAYYSEDPWKKRAFHGTCMYITEDGKMCAVGRVLLEPETMPTNGNLDTLLCKLSWAGRFPRTLPGDRNNYMEGNLEDDMVKEEYAGHSKKFWQDMQNLHDRDGYWDKEGITEMGEKYVKSLKEKYAE
jgi:hypothetical protein